MRERRHKPTPCPIMEGPPAKSRIEPTIRASSSLTGVRLSYQTLERFGLNPVDQWRSRQTSRIKTREPETWCSRVELDDQCRRNNLVVRWSDNLDCEYCRLAKYCTFQGSRRISGHARGEIFFFLNSAHMRGSVVLGDLLTIKRGEQGAPPLMV